ncbi:MAG TPA: hypothetical protein EYQ42_11245 [Thiotrichaceae bacterium]|jgi:chemotaxis protein CheC|nr:hypothetical protein [Thiotrichaceae bacterium]
MGQLNEFEKDSIGELLNIAMGMAASQLSEIAGNEVDMTVPSVDLITCSEYKKILGNYARDNLIGVSEEFSGGFSGEAALIFFLDKSMDLVRSMLGNLDYEDHFTDMEEEVLTEIGNILLNSCIAAFSNVLKKELHTELPQFNKGSLENILPSLDDGNDEETYILLAKIGFSVQQQEISSHLALTLTLYALRSLINELNLAFNIAV